MSVTSIRLQPELELPLNELSGKLDRSKNYIINQAIKEYLERQSIEEERWQDTLLALDSVKSGRGVDESEVTEWLNGWGTEQEKGAPKV
ncbi:MAG: CopG family ribbon-helix-helix protein [Pseudomonadales bacterium]|nr:CopG family ribbon-helix-helix protein [Pseudomonadales bacterium]